MCATYQVDLVCHVVVYASTVQYLMAHLTLLPTKNLNISKIIEALNDITLFIKPS